MKILLHIRDAIHRKGDILRLCKGFSLSIEKEYEKAKKSVINVFCWQIAGALSFSLVLWLMLRKMVISPIKTMEKAALDVAEGAFQLMWILRARMKLRC